MSIFGNGEATYKERLDNFITRLESKYPTLEYLGGYIDSDKPVMLKCKRCGYEFKASAQCIREKHNTSCKNCIKLDKLINKYKKNAIDKYEIEILRLRKELYYQIKKNTYQIKHCKRCNSEVITKYANKQLCDKCARKSRYKNHSNKSLKELYKRDNGICYLCNKKCDYEDYTYRGSTFIAGNYYPSIDHVIPLCKGGTDDWNNLRLAHRICNSMKSLKDTA
jgi:hypothetical protein